MIESGEIFNKFSLSHPQVLWDSFPFKFKVTIIVYRKHQHNFDFTTLKNETPSRHDDKWAQFRLVVLIVTFFFSLLNKNVEALEAGDG